MAWNIRLRKRIFLAVEGEGERSFVKWLQKLSDEAELFLNLDCEVLGGGGYEYWLNETIRLRGKKARNECECILLVDADRAVRDDPWSLDDLRREVQKNNIHVVFQQPNQEGLLLKMMLGKETLQPDAGNAHAKLSKAWCEYRKPVDAQLLSLKYSLNDLLRTARFDHELKKLLMLIGLFPADKVEELYPVYEIYEEPITEDY